MKHLKLFLLLMFTLTSIAAYWYTANVEQRRGMEIERLNVQVNKSAQIISQEVRRWRKELLSLAQAPSLLDSLNAGEGAVSEWLAAHRSGRPEVSALRVLRPDLMQTDDSESPPLGYAGLDLLRKAAASKKLQMPEIHMLRSEQQHIALAAPVIQAEQTLAVVLISLELAALEDVFNSAIKAESSAFFSLKQGASRVFSAGDRSQQKSHLVKAVPVPGTRWRIGLHKQLETTPFSYLELQAYIFIAAVLVLLSGFALSVLTNKGRQQEIRDKYKAMKMANKAKKVAKAAKARAKAEPAIEAEQQIDLELAESIKEKTAPTKGTTNPIFIKDDAIEVVTQLDVPRSIFRAYDIRGIIDDSLTEQGVFVIGRAIASEALAAGQKTLVVARDGRLHSPRLSESLVKGIRDCGCDVLDIGQVPTPVLYFATHTLGTQSGVMITGSHNPANYNGLKVVIAGTALSGDAIQQLYHRIEQEDFASGEGSYQEQMILPEYIGEVSADVRLGRMMKVVVDCGNGVAGEAAPMLLSTLGCEVIPLHCDIDGEFPNHHPDPSKPENLQELIAKVREEDAELGLAFDGDGDRLGVVDSQGNIIWPDRQMMLYAIDVLSRQAGADIIYDVKCTRNLAKIIAKHGGKPVMSKTGHSLMKAKMKENNAELGGEMSGHIFFKERWFGFDDALYTAARLLEILTAEFRPTAEIFAELPDSIATPEINMSLAEGENFSFVEKFQAQASFEDAKLITLDGLRVEFKDGWGLLRASNTTPSLVLRFEADDEQGLERIKQLFREQMLKINAALELTF
ncbi:phosphomannomutase/phosphoglucomutase [Cycloclasticus sp. 46_120_T64]|nr:phosphomannomutase/phosphoglucomutase [Cycloclasticus sp. 46_120_T64]